MTVSSDFARCVTVVYILISWFLLARILAASAIEGMTAVTERLLKTIDNTAVAPVTLARNPESFEFRMSTAAIVFLAVLAWGTVLFYCAGYDLVESIYASVSTLSTVGFGEYVLPGGALWRLVSTCYVLASTVTTAWCVSTMIELVADRQQALTYKRIMQRRLSHSQRRMADSDGDGVVTESEFILFKLNEMNLLDSKRARAARGHHRELKRTCQPTAHLMAALKSEFAAQNAQTSRWSRA